MSKLARIAGRGIVAGALMGCTEPRVVAAPMTATSASAPSSLGHQLDRDAGGSREKRAVKEPPTKGCCAGKNDCKGKSSCAVEGRHGCAGKNDCKGTGTTCFGMNLE